MSAATYTRLSVYQYQRLFIDNVIYVAQRFHISNISMVILLKHHRRLQHFTDI